MPVFLRYVLCVIGLVATVSACADRITAPPQTSEAQAFARASAKREGAFVLGRGTAAAHGKSGSPYYCSVSSLVQGKTYQYEYGTVLLGVTPAELAADGAVAIYNVISFGGGGEVVGRARCQIPDTDAARRHVDRFFHVRPVPSSINRVGERIGTVTQSDGIGIEGVTAYACRYGGTFPFCNYGPPMVPTWQQTQVQCPAMDPSCGSGGGSDTGEWDWEGGTGDTSEPPPPDDPRDPCRRDAQGYCVPEVPTTIEWQRLLDAIEGIKENNEACAGAKRYLQQLASNGRGASLKMWSGYDVVEGTQYYGANRLNASGTRFIQWDRDWVFRELALVVHEGLHAYFSLLADNSGVEQSSEGYAKQYHETCGYTLSAEWKASGR